MIDAVLAWLAFALLIWLFSRFANRRRNRQPDGAWWAWYDSYLRTPEWRELRRACFERDDYRCQYCGVRSRVMMCHHLTYARAGRELLSDLVTVCYDCHRNLHPNRSF